MTKNKEIKRKMFVIIFGILYPMISQNKKSDFYKCKRFWETVYNKLLQEKNEVPEEFFNKWLPFYKNLAEN